MRGDPSPLAERIGQRVREKRKHMGLSLDKLCARTELSKPFLSDVENGKQLPGAASILRLCRALGLSADVLLGVNEEERNQ